MDIPALMYVHFHLAVYRVKDSNDLSKTTFDYIENRFQRSQSLANSLRQPKYYPETISVLLSRKLIQTNRPGRALKIDGFVFYVGK
ncbi:hypothetical protein NPIL_500651 [Nephila pilipes]|uniref:Uncharacterized protein n=1 Tax=Nephila pilipes TaxID=299642 RepID=A0A8X6TXU3_NEPPI|nr:hypothetical protein NPIL_500651 [Nephila pilipes]